MSHPYASYDLSGLVAVVTGAGSAPADVVGNGRAVATLLARRGAQVAAVDVDAARVKSTAEAIRQEGGSCLPLVGSVTDEQFCQEIATRTAAEFGGIDLLFNNVGIGGPRGTVVDVDLDGWRDCLEVNISSMLLTSRFVIPRMVERGAGSIVNMSSVAGLIGGHGNIGYSVSKGAIVNMTRSMAAQHGAESIRVNCVAPGMAYTAMVASRGLSEELRARRRERSILQTEGTPWDIAEAVTFLLSPAARWITGVTIPVDAGRTAGDRANPAFQIGRPTS